MGLGYDLLSLKTLASKLIILENVNCEDQFLHPESMVLYLAVHWFLQTRRVQISLLLMNFYPFYQQGSQAALTHLRVN